MTPTAFDLVSVDGDRVVRNAESEVSSVRRTGRLTRPDQLSFDVLEGPHEPYEERRLLRITYASAPTEWWRIVQRTHARGQRPTLSCSCEPRWLDLDRQIAYIELADGTKLPGVTVTRLAVEDAMARILSGDLAAPSEYAVGNVPADLQGEEVSVFGEAVSHLELLSSLAEQLGAQWQAEWDDGAGEYKVNLLAHVGDPDATNRVITDRTGDDILGTPNVKRVTGKRDARKYFSHLIPIGGEKGQRKTIADAVFQVESAGYDSGPNETTITADGRVEWKANSLAGIAVHRYRVSNPPSPRYQVSPTYEERDAFVSRTLLGGSGTAYPIVATEPPSTIVVEGDASGESTFSIKTAEGRDVISLRSPQAVSEIGRSETRETFDVVPYANLLERAGVTADGSDLTGWQAQGNPSLSLSTEANDVRHGDGAVQMQGGKGDAVVTAPYNFQPSEDGPVVSAWISLRLTSGKVSVALVDAAGNVLPPDQQLTSSASTLQAFSIGGEKPAPGDLRVRVACNETNTDVRIDSATLVASATPVAFAGQMGPKQLWQAGVEHMIEKGGRQTRRLSGETFDLNELEGLGLPFHAGDAVTVDLRQMDKIETRLSEVTRRLSIGRSSAAVNVRTTDERSTGLSGFREERTTPRPPENASTPKVAPSVDVQLDDTGTTGVVDLLVEDPSQIVASVEVRKRAGGNIEDTQSWRSMTLSGGSYTETVALEEKHPSQIQWRIVNLDGEVVTGQTHTFDFDNIPQGNYSLSFKSDPNSSGILVEVACRGDEDTASYVSEFTGPGGNTETVTADGRQAVITANSNFPLSEGDLFDLTVTGYAETGGNGEPETEPFVQTDIETPGTSSSGGGPGDDLTAGDGIDINSNTISVDDTVARTDRNEVFGSDLTVQGALNVAGLENNGVLFSQSGGGPVTTTTELKWDGTNVLIGTGHATVTDRQETISKEWTHTSRLILDATSLRTKGAATGFSGSGTIIDDQQSWFDDVQIRGTLFAREFEIRKLQVSKGTRIFGPGGGKVKEVVGQSSTSARLRFEEEPGIQNGDFCLIKTVNTTGGTIAEEIRLEVTSVIGGTEVTFSKISATRQVEVGDEVVVVGSTDTNRDSLLIASPFIPAISTLDGINSFNDWDNRQPGARFGKINGMPSIGGQAPSGHGLWGNNVFLEGTVVANKGAIADSVTVGSTQAQNLASLTDAQNKADAAESAAESFASGLDSTVRTELNTILDNAVANGTTIIDGGFLKNSFIQTSAIAVGDFSDDGSYTTPAEAQSKADTAESNAESFASGLDSSLRTELNNSLDNAIANGTTLIVGGFLKNSFIQTSTIAVGDFNDDGSYTTPAEAQSKADTAESNAESFASGLDSSLRTELNNSLDNAIANGTTIITGGLIKTNFIDVDDIFATNATVAATLTMGTAGEITDGTNWQLDQDALTFVEGFTNAIEIVDGLGGSRLASLEFQSNEALLRSNEASSLRGSEKVGSSGQGALMVEAGGGIDIFTTNESENNTQTSITLDAQNNSASSTPDGDIVMKGRNMVFNGSVIHSSDRTLKENITQLDDPMQVLMNISGCRYVRTRSQRCELGLIAQEVQAAGATEAVREMGKDTLGIDYTAIHAYEIEALKDHEKRIHTLEQKVL